MKKPKSKTASESPAARKAAVLAELVTKNVVNVCVCCEIEL